MTDATMSNDNTFTPHIDPAIFQSLQAKIDEESAVRDELKTFVETLSKQSRLIHSILSRIFNTPTASLATTVLDPATAAIANQFITVKQLAEIASGYPFYKYNELWRREIQNLISSIQLVEWLATGRLVTLDQVGQKLGVPANVKDVDTFHLTIEDYLLSLCSTIDELARLAPNAVTLGDFSRPRQISEFIKDVHAGFQLLNLKNDALRRRSDGIKYSMKRVEDVVYDLSLRGLMPKE